MVELASIEMEYELSRALGMLVVDDRAMIFDLDGIVEECLAAAGASLDAMVDAVGFDFGFDFAFDLVQVDERTEVDLACSEDAAEDAEDVENADYADFDVNDDFAVNADYAVNAAAAADE